MDENTFTSKYKAKLANSKEKHEVGGALRKMGMTSHSKALSKRK